MRKQALQVWILTCILIGLPFNRSGDAEECGDEVSLLQHVESGRSKKSHTGNKKGRAALSLERSSFANHSNHSAIGKCPPEYNQSFEYTQELQERPIKEVLQQHPGIDGWCLARSVALVYWGICSDARQQRDYNHFARGYDRRHEMIREENHDSVIIPLEGGNITSRDTFHSEDDAICVANGFYDIPREKALNDFDYVTAMSDKHCKWLREEIPEFDNISMDWLNLEERSDDAALAALWHGSPSPADKIRLSSLKYNMLKHEAVKCLLGGVGCDIVFCARRGCIGADGVVKYGLNATC